MGYKQLALIVCSISKSIFALIICSMLTSENLIWGKWIFPSQIIAIYIHLYNLVNVDKWKSYDRQSLSSPPPPPWSQDGSHCHPPETLGHNLCQLFTLSEFWQSDRQLLRDWTCQRQSPSGGDFLKRGMPWYMLGNSEVEFVHAVSAGGSVKFLPAE